MSTSMQRGNEPVNKTERTIDPRSKAMTPEQMKNQGQSQYQKMLQEKGNLDGGKKG